MTVFDYVMWVFAGVNVYCAVRSGMIVRRLLKETPIEEQVIKEQEEEIFRLRCEVNRLTPCASQFSFVWRSIVNFEMSRQIMEWVNRDMSGKLSIEVEEEFLMDGCFVRVSTEDKQAAMMFKLAWGGAQ